MLDKDICGLLATLIAIVSNGAYFISVLKRRTKPHVFSWTIWGLLTAITYFAQSSADAGPGAWHMAVNSAICFIVAALAVSRGNLDIKRSDLAAFACALAAIPLWYVTRQPLVAVIVVIAVEAFAYYPTFRKSWLRPHEELALTYSLDCGRCLISIAAMQSYSATTILYPAFIAVVNVGLVSMLLRRRRVLPPIP